LKALVLWTGAFVVFSGAVSAPPLRLPAAGPCWSLLVFLLVPSWVPSAVRVPPVSAPSRLLIGPFPALRRRRHRAQLPLV